MTKGAHTHPHNFPDIKHGAALFTPKQWGIVRFCAEEVRRQHDTAEHVYHMLVAWSYALEREDEALTEDDVKMIGQLVCPGLNVGGRYRSVGVMVGTRVCPNPREVPELMARWASHLNDTEDNPGAMTAEEAYLEYEMIHPWADGNGRSGKVIYSWLRGELRSPQWPPDFFGGIGNP